MADEQKRDPTTDEQLWQDPDWTCPVCGYINLAIRGCCRNCSFDSEITHAGMC